MSHPHALSLVQRLQGRCTGDVEGPAPCAQRVPVSDYTDGDLLEREREGLILARPLILCHQSQIVEPGDALVHDWLGLPLITLRDSAGQVRTFMNVCRHRGMRLVRDAGPAHLRSLVCPYHQWTYGLDGALRRIPRQESFAGIEPEAMGLVALPTEVRHGLVWLQADRSRPLDLDGHLAGLGADLDLFNLADYHFCHQHVREVACNWKLVQDAFLDGYHVTRLHRDTVGPFFLDSMAESDEIGYHQRSAVARRELLEAAGLPPAQLDLRHHVTFSYTVFPNSVLIFHPDYTSIISLYPLAPDRTVFAHVMLTPHPPASDGERDHYLRSFRLIDSGVFQAEDIFVSEGAQRGMASGANDTLLFGGLEESALRFHRAIRRALGRDEL